MIGAEVENLVNRVTTPLIVDKALRGVLKSAQ